MPVSATNSAFAEQMASGCRARQLRRGGLTHKIYKVLLLNQWVDLPLCAASTTSPTVELSGIAEKTEGKFYCSGNLRGCRHNLWHDRRQYVEFVKNWFELDKAYLRT